MRRRLHGPQARVDVGAPGPPVRLPVVTPRVVAPVLSVAAPYRFFRAADLRHPDFERAQIGIRELAEPRLLELGIAAQALLRDVERQRGARSIDHRVANGCEETPRPEPPAG